MSLINDALKKAQKQRTGDNTPLSAMPSVGGESAARIAKRAKPVGFNSLLLRIGLGAGVVLVLVIGGYFVMRSKPALLADAPQSAGQTPGLQPPASVPSSSPDANPLVLAPVVQSPEPRPKNPELAVTTAPASPKSAVGGFVLPIVTPPPQAPLPVVAKQTAGQTPGLQPQTTVPPARPSTFNRQPSTEAPTAAPAPAVKLDARAITYIESLRIAGIRASATDAKVLMNDRVYRVGDIVEHEMNLKLIGITANSLTFEDEHGGRYTRQF